MTLGETVEIDSPAKLPEPGHISKIEEPVITAMILTPAEFVGVILQLCQDKRGVQKQLEFKAADRVLITYGHLGRCYGNRCSHTYFHRAVGHTPPSLLAGPALS